MTVRLTRRSVSRAGIASLLATPFVLRAEPAMAEETIVYVSAGGTTQEAQEKTILAAFQKETGIKVLSVAGADLAKMKAQQMSGNIEWDVINLQAGQAVFAATHDMLEKVDYSVVDASDSFMSPRNPRWHGTSSPAASAIGPRPTRQSIQLIGHSSGMQRVFPAAAAYARARTRHWNRRCLLMGCLRATSIRWTSIERSVRSIASSLTFRSGSPRRSRPSR